MVGFFLYSLLTLGDDLLSFEEYQCHYHQIYYPDQYLHKVQDNMQIMFDFEQLKVYQKARELNVRFLGLTKSDTLDSVTRDQLRRASFSIILNIAEGSGRFSDRDRRRFYVIARGSVFECVAIIDFMVLTKTINEKVRQSLYAHLEELSKMLFAMIRRLE